MSEPVSCPECGSYNVAQTTAPEVDGVAQYRCCDCGEYFTDEAAK